jgi:hypothetical protein
MTINKKYLIVSMFAFSMTCFANQVMATRQWVKGVPQVHAVYSGSNTLDSFDLVGVTNPVGSCPVDSNGEVMATINKTVTNGVTDTSGDRLWSLVLAAELANKKVKVFLDDTVTDANGQCLAIAIYIVEKGNGHSPEDN